MGIVAAGMHDAGLDAFVRRHPDLRGAGQPGLLGHGQTGLSGASKVRSEEHTSELQSLMRISYAVFCLKKKTTIKTIRHPQHHTDEHTTTQHDTTEDTSKNIST